MKYKPLIWTMLTGRMKPGLKEYWKGDVGELLRRAKPIYKDLLSKVESVSDDNPMASNITMSFVIIAVWLASDRKLRPEEMSRVMEMALDWKPVKMMYGRYDANTEKGLKIFSDTMHANADWLAAHPEDTEAWDFNFDETLHRDGFYYHFTRCPIAAFCKKYGYEEINPVLCNLDYLTVSLAHGVLHREHTVADGDGMCDYWIVGDRTQDPE